MRARRIPPGRASLVDLMDAASYDEVGVHSSMSRVSALLLATSSMLFGCVEGGLAPERGGDDGSARPEDGGSGGSDGGDGGDAALIFDVDPPCKAGTCASLGKNCGLTSDECGGTLDCGTCKGSLICGGGSPNVCGSAPCVPQTCAGLGKSCGSVGDGCGKLIECGVCTTGYSCVSGACKKSNWTACASDGDCASSWCGCNGAAPPTVCLPNSTYPKWCKKENWTTCSSDGECISGWCGCNGSPPPTVCLPNTTYPKVCG